jgi:hypothetical protein
MAKTYRCKLSFVVGVAGTNRVVRTGELISGNDPRVKNHQDLLRNEKYFEPAQDYIDRTIEEATAVPGEKRALPEPKKRKPTRKVEPVETEVSQ